MSEQDEQYKQLALFSIIVADVVLLPAATGGLTYYLTKAFQGRLYYTIFGALVGLLIAFYRISLMMKNQDKPNDP